MPGLLTNCDVRLGAPHIFTVTDSDVGMWAESASAVQSGGVLPYVQEDFAEYASQSQLTNNSASKYTSKLDGSSDGNETSNAALITLDTTKGYTAGGLTQSMKYPFPAVNQADYTIGCNLALPNPQNEIWLEVIAQFSANFTTKGPVTTANPDYKFVFGRVQTSGRFNVMTGTSSNLLYTLGYPAHEDDFEGGNAGALFDGNWHTFRWHMKVGSSGACRLLVDGSVVKDYGTVNMATNQIYGVALGRNMNQGTSNAMNLWWGRITVYNTDPGSGW